MVNGIEHTLYRLCVTLVECIVKVEYSIVAEIEVEGQTIFESTHVDEIDHRKLLKKNHQ